MTENNKVANNIQSRIIDPGTLEDPQSRVEYFLHFINGTGRVAFADLPKPQSRVEWLLYYLCEQIHLGNIGGGVAPIQYIQNAALVGKILTLTKQDGSIVTVDLTPYVEKWEDLDHVEKYNDVNLMQYNKKVTGYRYGAGDIYVEDANWSVYYLDVELGKQYSVIGRTNNNNRFVYVETDGGTKVDAFTVNSVIQSNNFYIMPFTVPTTNSRIKKLAISFEHGRNTINDMMILEGEHTSVDGFIPYADRKVIQIGTDVSYAFDNEGTDLKSTTVSSAIKELCEKINENILPLTDYHPINKFNRKEIVLGRRYNNTGDIVSDPYYATYTYPCTAGQTFTIAKRVHDDERCVYLTQDNQIVQVTTIPKFTRNDILHYRVTVPNDNRIAKIGFNIKTTVNTTQVMIFDGHNDLPVGTIFTPYLAEKLIDGDKILHSFNNVGTNLSSKTTSDAIEELSLSKVDKYTTTFNRHKSYKDFNAKYYRIPSLLATNKGTLLSFADIRHNTAKDQSLIDIGVARSTDDGTLWNNTIAMKNTGQHPTESRVMDSTSVFVPNANKIILLAGGWDSGTSNWTTSTATPDPLWNPFIVTSTDDGLSWSDRESLKGRVTNEPNNTVAWLGGVGTGIVKKKGNNIGRIILPIQICVRDVNANRNVVKAGCIYSDNDGVDWSMSTKFAEDGTSENMIAEIGNGDLIMIARRDAYASKGAYFSTDGGETWELHRTLSGAFTHGGISCQNSWITIELNGQTIGLLSHPKNTSNSYQRDNITIYMYNFDNPSQGIVELYNVYPYLGNASGAGYSSLCYYKNINGIDKLAIAFETNGNIEFRDITDVLHSKNITLINNKLIELSDKKVDKYTPSFASDLTVEDLKISGNYIKHSGSSSQVGLAGNRTLAGDKATSITQGTKISTIQIGLDGYSEGETVTGVEVYAVNKNTDTIVECITFNGAGIARMRKDSSFDFPFVDVEVNKSFGEDVYFIAGIKQNNGKGMRLGGRVSTGIAFDKTSENELQVGSPIALVTTRTPFLYVYGEVSLSDAIVNVECNTANIIEFVRANGTRIRVDVANGSTTTITI
ncbi:sialidase family protein [Romboutsia timonensis]|uniref:sialidase family protein n=1 Tax=Romboutsia timonensis TaxID=1776391 RepID=UPI002A7F3142|nr:sialidase family protein [Romboutsia timonensis]MDY3960161.1 sialidase family protein [Romboutsia timonensis]